MFRSFAPCSFPPPLLFSFSVSRFLSLVVRFFSAAVPEGFPSVPHLLVLGPSSSCPRSPISLSSAPALCLLKELHFFSYHFAEQQIGQTTGAQAKPLVGQPLLAQHFLDDGIIDQGIVHGV